MRECKITLNMRIKILAIIIWLSPILALANSSGVKISEIGASEPSGFEWVEIVNTGSAAVDISTWKFFEGNTNHGLKEVRGSSLLAPGEYAIIAQDAAKLVTKYPNLSHVFDSSWSTLTEAGEYIALKNTNGDIEEGFTYAAAPDGFLARTNLNIDDYTAANWKEVAQSSIGQANNNQPVVNPPPASSPPSTSSATSYQLPATSSAVSPPPPVSIKTDPLSLITLTVTVPPGVFGTRTMYGEHEGVGYEVYSYYSDFPALKIGDEITVHGELSTTNLLHRIKIKQSIDITKIGSTVVSPFDIRTIELEQSLIGRLAEVRGILLEIRGRKQFIVEYDGHELQVVLKTNTGLSLPRTEEGTPIRVTGIVGFRDGAFILYPRVASDLSVTIVSKNTNVKIATVEVKTPPPAPSALINTKKVPSVRTIGLTLILLGASSLLALLIRHRDKIFKSDKKQVTSDKE